MLLGIRALSKTTETKKSEVLQLVDKVAIAITVKLLILTQILIEKMNNEVTD